MFFDNISSMIERRIELISIREAFSFINFLCDAERSLSEKKKFKYSNKKYDDICESLELVSSIVFSNTSLYEFIIEDISLLSFKVFTSESILIGFLGLNDSMNCFIFEI